MGYRRLLPFYRAVNTQPDKVDVLHLHWLGPYLKGNSVISRWFYAIKFLVDIFIVQISGVRVVWTVHNLIAHDTQYGCLERWIRRRLAKIVDQLIVHNHSSKESVVDLYLATDSSVSVISIGHYREIYESPIDASAARKILGLPAIGNIYLWQGLLRPYKGVESLLKIWSEHKEVFADHTLVIAGAAPDKSYEEKIANMAAQIPGVHTHLEFIEDNRMHLFFSAATVVALPFKQILTSSSLVLAMSYARPVIAPRLGGIPETLGDADWLLYDSSDELGLLHAFKESMEINLSELSQIVGQVCDLMDWPNIAKKTQQLYQSILNN
ncbi:glycosyltransferase [Leptothoe sp. LEGE 181152]|nr:glycosyltransferase [Leptothoe sp. LEGE 181152]